MEYKRSKFHKLLTVCLLLLGVAVGLGLWQRTLLLKWYYLRGLTSATEDDCQSWVQSIISLDQEAVPGLLDLLHNPENRVCNNVRSALTGLVNQWGFDDPRSAALSAHLYENFTSFSEPGQEAVLDWQLDYFQLAGKNVPAEVRDQAELLLQLCVPRLELGVRTRSLAMARALLDLPLSEKTKLACQELITRELRANEQDLCLKALHLCMHPVNREDAKVIRDAVPLLKHGNAEIRRSALLAVGTHKEVVSEEVLLPLLHDPNWEVCDLCVTALKSRGLSDDQILLGGFISDPDPKGRLKIVLHLPRVEGIDPGVWVQRLSKDRDEAVRAAAARLAGYYLQTGPGSGRQGIRQASAKSTDFQGGLDLRDRLADMAVNDSSETVRQIARYYLYQPSR